jgi:hypothetical protein
MKSLKIALIAFVLLSVFACKKSETSNSQLENEIITNDTSEFNGRLYVIPYNAEGTLRLTNTDIFLYISYDDLKRNLPLNAISTGSFNSQADFGFLLQGNYYIRATKDGKADTSLVQVLSRRSIYKNMFLK